MNKETRQILIELYEKQFDENVRDIKKLARSGSAREYFRITGNNNSAIGVFNNDRKENVAFIEFTKSFLESDVNAPQIYQTDLENAVYLEEDLGDETLFGHLSKIYKKGIFPKELIELYKNILTILPKIQIDVDKKIDYSKCYPRSSFDRQSMMWDLNYFKYYFLKLAHVSFDEQLLEDDFQKFCDYLLNYDNEYFLYRDFQSRNIMLKNNKIYFIDYQGGRKGALQYDVASLLYDAKANIPQHIRKELLEYYIDELQKYIKIDKEKFIKQYYGFVLVRIMQAMGAYGFRGFYERKEHFLKSIPYAIKNMKYILETVELPVKIPFLMEALKNVVESKWLKKIGEKKNNLKIRINSFAFKNGIPGDAKGNGGGFVFDCRGILNPGRIDKYKSQTGKDENVIKYLEEKTEIKKFLTNIYDLVDGTVENYIDRNFTDLLVNFGCTGGQHRSVYSAEKLAEHLEKKYDISISINHRELEN
ncbi:MAG: RNase adapter RapZ [Candidatus Marinimicrobia bacterium]|nr:RNase adapter RapZ [Candidatus Neomarinimicrobiota bacterium]